MEIISYVGFNSKNYNSVPAFERSARKISNWISEKNKIFRTKAKSRTFSTGIASIAREQAVAARPSHTPFSIKAEGKHLLVACGQFVNFIEANAVKILISVSVLALVIAGTISGALLISYNKNHTNPLVFQNTQTEEELLSSFMQAFACDKVQDYLSDGTLVGSENAAAVSSIESLVTLPVSFQTYRVKNGDTISGITKKFGLSNISTIIAVNNIQNVRYITAGKKLRIPSVDGLIYTVQKGNTLQGLSAKFSVPLEKLLDINELESAELTVGQELFIPGARLGSEKLLEALGELFKKPIKAKFRYTSMFGPRLDPISGAKSNHTGIDLACPTGTPIYASCAGTVAFVGYSNIFGNYVIIKHANGYQTLYGHMSQILAKKGQLADQNTKIGLVGSTGYSTGPHLHFTVYKNGKLVDPMSVLK